MKWANSWRKKEALVFLVLSFFGITAIVGSSYLGKFYIGMLASGNYKKYKNNFTELTIPASQSSENIILLDPLPLYMVQVGVFSDPQGGEKGAASASEKGYFAHVTQDPPYRVLIGVFVNREAAGNFAKNAAGQGLGSYVFPLVLNGKELLIEDSRSLKQLKKFLTKYNEFLKTVINLWNTHEISGLDKENFKKYVDEINKNYRLIPLLNSNFSTVPGINESVLKMKKDTENYLLTLKQMENFWNDKSFNEAQGSLLKMVDDYIHLLNALETENKT